MAAAPGGAEGAATSRDWYSCPPNTGPPRIQMKDVVTMARMVPVGMDFCASLRSPDRFEPAMMPVEAEAGDGPQTHLGDAAHPALSGRVRGWWGVGRGFLTMHGRDPRLHGAAVRTLGLTDRLDLTAHCRTAGHVGGHPESPTLSAGQPPSHEPSHRRDQSTAQPRAPTPALASVSIQLGPRPQNVVNPRGRESESPRRPLPNADSPPGQAWVSAWPGLSPPPPAGSSLCLHPHRSVQHINSK